MTLPSPILRGVYHLTLLSWECGPASTGRCLQALEGARMEALAAQIHFFHLIFILNKSLKVWHVLKMCGKGKITNIVKEFRCSIEIFFNIYHLLLSLVVIKWWEREKRMQSSGWKMSHQEVRKLKRSVIMMGFPKQHELGVIPQPKHFMLLRELPSDSRLCRTRSLCNQGIRFKGNRNVTCPPEDTSHCQVAEKAST